MEKIKELFERRMNLMHEISDLTLKKRDVESALTKDLVNGGHGEFISINWRALTKYFWRK